uniref:Uncharacterized protein n=1 Tax=Micrurus lemniscatus lemniscatus TaxID=129467 RepID=A0A2D4JPU6_MICLE
MNPGKKQYIFYSNMHQSWSKIDMTWMTPELNGNVQEIEIETKLWAGHNPVKISWKAHKRKIRWTLNQSITKEKEFIWMMEKEIEFFKENRKDDTVLPNVCDTSEAIIRGLATTFIAKKNKKKKQY